MNTPDAGTPQALQAPNPATQPQHPPKPPDDVLKRGMRAPETVLKLLSAPRSDRLASVLSTLQPDQHRLVSWPHDEPLIVQGHPGTGKTIVATYRAAYLVNPALYDDKGPLAGRRGLRILLVGPTDAYVEHVSEIIRPLYGVGLIRLTHLEQFLGDTTLVKGQWGGGIGGGGYSDVDAKARGLAEQAARIARANSLITEGPGSARANIKVIYDLIRSNGTTQKRISSDDAQVAWMEELPDFDRAFRQRRYLPLMAQCRIAYKPIPDIDKYDHIIVDEAQDVSPIEWNVLDQYLARDGHWALLGDMNQRRSDTTYGSWQQIADHLGLGDGDSAFDVQTMRRGYRSTNPILRFADKLLPANVTADRSRPTGRLSSLRRCAQLDSSCRRSSNWPLASPPSTARGRPPSSRWIRVPSCRNSASLAGGSRDEKGSSGPRMDFRFASIIRRRHVDLSSTRSWWWSLEPSPRTSDGRRSCTHR